MKMSGILCVMAGLLLLAGTSGAYPSLLGPTGGVNVPVADTVGAGTVQIGMDYVNNCLTYYDDYGHAFNAGNSLSTRILFGVSPNAEIGLSYNAESISIEGNYDHYHGYWDNYYSDANFWGINGKVVWALPSPGFTAGIGGVFQQSDSDNVTSVGQVYGVLSQVLLSHDPMLPAIRGSVGVNWTGMSWNDDYTGDSHSDSAVRAFVNLDVALQGGLHISGEYQLKDSAFDDEPITSLVARYPLNISRTLVGQLGVTNAYLGMSGEHDHYLFFGASYRF